MKVTYMNGAGNDFMVIDARGATYDFETMAKEYCAITGADGFMAVDYSDVADFRLHFYNSDGSRGEMCGNGARCICRFAYDLGIVGKNMVVQTDAGLVPGECLDGTNFRVRLNNPSALDLNRKGDVAYVELGNPGVPHAVAECPDLDWDTAEGKKEIFRSLRFDPAFPKGANVNFYRWLGDAHVQVLTFERGVEDYTLACGTGTGSVAATLWMKGQLPFGHLVAENKGGTLSVTITGENGVISAIDLEGPTEVVQVYEL